ncbi:MAG TPA: hypothetical protein VGI74_07725 [Streptosporangiaceae bacterium]
MTGREPDQLVWARLVARLRQAIPGLGEQAAHDALAAARVRVRALRGLDAHLATHPDALTSGDPRCPLPLMRLAWVLADAGHARVRPPRCAHCGQPARRMRKLTPQGRVCDRCAERVRARRCGACGKQAQIARRADDTTPDLCQACYQRTLPQAQCEFCGHQRVCHRAPDGRRRCAACRPMPRQDCAHCGQRRPVQARWPLGPVCAACYDYIREHPATCARCGLVAVLTGRSHGGAGLCGPCCGYDRDYLCQSCGQPGELHASRTCHRCVLRQRLASLLTTPASPATPQLRPLAEALAAADNPRTMLEWLRKPTGQLFTRLARDGAPITHDLLDTLPPGKPEAYLRATLVAAGVLPSRDEELERLGPWLDHLLRDRPASHARLVRPFATWQILRRARRNARTRTFTTGAAGFARARILIALEFLTWLDTRHRPLSQLTQSDVDTWLTTGSSNRYNIRYFLDWAGQRRLAPVTAIPWRPEDRPTSFLDPSQQWQHLRRCLTDDTLPLDLRAAGALILLFGTKISRIVALRTSDITTTSDGTYLTLGDNPVLLPPALSQLVHQLAASPHNLSALTRNLGGTTYLFPGKTAGHHLTTKHLGNELVRHGLDTRAARNTALITLATDLPAAVLAELLGLNIHTAERWTSYAKRDWTSYLAARDTTSPEEYRTP